MNKKISIIVPVYNVEQYLETCINSLLGQTYKNLEIILVDDGSVDNCPQLCDEFAKQDNRIKVIHKKNGGQSDARNRGLDLITGDLLFFVDSDDYINKYCLEILAKEMEISGAEIVECHSNNFTDGDNPDWKSQCTVKKRIEITPNEWFTEVNLGDFISSAVWNKLYRADLYKSIRFPTGRVYEDDATTYKVIYKAQKICRIDSKLYFYRIRSGSTMTGDMTLKKVSDRILTFQEQIEFFTLQRNDVAKKFSVSRLCLAAIGLIKPVKTLDPTGNTERELIGMIKSSYQKIKGVKSVPLKFRGYIKFFLLMYRK